MSRLNEEDRANLVAYLDGELDEESAHVLEARLNREPELRAVAEDLRKTWELLDYLPRPEPSPSFTHRTLERVAVKSTGKWPARPPGRWTWLGPLGWVAAVLLALGGGVFAAHHLWTPPAPTTSQQPVVTPAPPRSEVEEVMVKDWDLLKSYRQYEQMDDMEMLKQLGRKDYFGEEEPQP
jgi:anti-sigma factor RsiW